jgi:hypothetical protein
MKPSTRDSFDVLMRSFLEARDLLINFRISHKGTLDKIDYWFAGKMNNSWKPDHKKCEEFLRKIGTGEPELARRWSMVTALSHPTFYAASNSALLMATKVSGRSEFEDTAQLMEPKIADYLVSISTLIVSGTYDLPGWVPLACDPTRLPNVDPFHSSVLKIAIPYLDKTRSASLPKGSFRE